MAERDVAAKLREKNPSVLWKPISDKFGVGTPDRCCKFKHQNGFVFWVEIKFIRQLPKSSCKVGLKMKQGAWLKEWQSYGGNAFLIVGVASERKIAIFNQDFPRIATQGIERSEFNMINYEDASATIKRACN